MLFIANICIYVEREKEIKNHKHYAIVLYKSIKHTLIE
jgi:predicted nucleic acid-binding protein